MTTTRSHAARRLRTVALLLLVAVIAPLAGPLDEAAAQTRPASTAAAEQHFVDLLNGERQGRGLAPLVVNANLRSDARGWSATMAQAGRIFHTSTLGQDATRSVPGWRRVGENVGRGYDVPGLHVAFMNSPDHRANILGDYNQVGVGVVYTGTHTYVTVRFVNGPLPNPPLGSGTPDGDLWLANSVGRVFAFGQASHRGDASTLPLAAPIVGMTPTVTGGGYWLLGRDGGVFTYGDARFFGSTGGMRLNQPVNGMAATPTGRGYWLVASDGGIFAFGDAGFYGSAADGRLGAPTAGVTTSPTGHGYWVVGTNGRVAAFGDARHVGDASSLRLPSPIVRIQTTPDGGGYWLVGADGAVYPYGNAGSRISAPVSTGAPIVAVARR